MRSSARLLGAAALAVSLAVATSAWGSDVPLRNWEVPRSTLADAGSPGLFVPATPCRIADTRGVPPFTGAYAGPELVANGTRSFDIDSAPTCTGFPAGAAAFSLNFTVIGSPGAYQNAFLTVWPTGGTMPTVSTLNFDGGQLKANAAIVPAGTGGAVSVFVNAAAHLIIDINGYFMDRGGSISSNDFVGIYGNTDPTYAGLFLVSNGAAVAGTSAIRGIIGNTGTGTVGVSGEQNSASGRNYGVKGTNNSTGINAAAVYGVAGDATLSTNWSAAGVRGESTTGNGVLGLSVAAFTYGTAGFRVDSTGVILRGGALGGDSYGVSYNGGIGGSGTKAFLEPHPTDAGKMIAYVALEGPEAGTYFRGRGRFVGGSARIEVPESFRMVTDPEGLTVQVTPIGRATAVGVVRIGLDGIEVEANRDVEFSYLVQGVRKAYRDVQPFVENTFFRPASPEDRMPVSLTPDEKQRLVDNGTYKPDGTVNLDTAERMGWARLWRERAEAARAVAERNQAAAAGDANRLPQAGPGR